MQTNTQAGRQAYTVKQSNSWLLTSKYTHPESSPVTRSSVHLPFWEWMSIPSRSFNDLHFKHVTHIHAFSTCVYPALMTITRQNEDDVWRCESSQRKFIYNYSNPILFSTRFFVFHVKFFGGLSVTGYTLTGVCLCAYVCESQCMHGRRVWWGLLKLWRLSNTLAIISESVTTVSCQRSAWSLHHSLSRETNVYNNLHTSALLNTLYYTP